MEKSILLNLLATVLFIGSGIYLICYKYKKFPKESVKTTGWIFIVMGAIIALISMKSMYGWLK